MEYGVVRRAIRRLVDWVWQEREEVGLCLCSWLGAWVEAAPPSSYLLK